MGSTNERPVSERIWTNESAPLCLRVSRALLAGRAADWEGTPGAGQEGRFDWGQTGGTDRGGDEARPLHSRHLSQHRLPGPDISGGHQASPGSLDLPNSEGETFRVWSVQAEMFLAAQVSLATPGALHTHGGILEKFLEKYFIEYNLSHPRTDGNISIPGESFYLKLDTPRSICISQASKLFISPLPSRLSVSVSGETSRKYKS